MSQIGDTTVAQARLKMPLSRPLPGVASGVHELRLHDETRHFRVIYCLRPGLGVLVVSAFEKRTARTPFRELALARRRLKDLLDEAT